MAHNTTWEADCADWLESMEAARARTAVARDIADLREEWDLHVRIYGATEAQAAELAADFAALETLGFESADIEAFEAAYGALDQKIHALDVEAREENVQPVMMAAFINWTGAQSIARAV